MIKFDSSVDLAMGIFAKSDIEGVEYDGLLYGGGMYLLGIQAIAVVAIAIWTIITTAILLWIIGKLVPLRTSLLNGMIQFWLFRQIFQKGSKC